MERILRQTAEFVFFLAVVVAVAIDSLLYAFRGRGLVGRNGQGHREYADN